MSRYHVVDLRLENNSKYSPELRTLCHLDAKERLVFPTLCPRCIVPDTRFKIFMTYTDGKAGLWSVLCHGCNQVHTPDQEGPPEDVRHLIQERIQHEASMHEREACEKREQRAKKANSRAIDKLLKKERKTMKDASKKEKALKQAEHATRRALKRDAAHLEHLRDIRGGLANLRTKNASHEKSIIIPRRVELSFWTKNDTNPMNMEVEVADPSCCDLSSIPQVAQSLQSVNLAEHWDLYDARWMPGIAPVDIRHGAPAILVRDIEVTRCLDFGFHVHLLQDGAASTAKGRKEALKAAGAVRKEVSARVGLTSEVWVVLWSKDETKAEVYRLPLDAKRRVKLTTDTSVRTALGLSKAVDVWNLMKTDWQEYRTDDSIPVRNNDTILVRVPDVEGLKFFGVELEQLLLRDTPYLSQRALGSANCLASQEPVFADLAAPLLSAMPGTLDNAFF